MRSPPSTAARRANAAAVFAVAITVLSWASAFPLIRVGMRALGPLELASARFLVAGAIALAWLAFSRPPLPTRADALRNGRTSVVDTSEFQAVEQRPIAIAH